MQRFSHIYDRFIDGVQRGWPRLYRGGLYVWKVLVRTIVKYNETDGEQRAASFAYYAFFSLFPLLLLLISLGAMLMGDQPGAQDKATKMTVDLVKDFIPVAEGQANWFVDTVTGVVKSRNKAGVIAFLALAWSAIRFFQALVHGVNKAWGTKEYSWWRIPIQNLFMVGVVASALLLGIVLPYVINQFEPFFWRYSYLLGFDFGAFKDQITFTLGLAREIVPSIVLFYGFAMLYKFAPRRRTTFKEVWFASLLVTMGLQGLQGLFVIYSTNIGEFNRLYGTLGSVIALLMWIYLSGSVIILGGCISAATYEVKMSLTDQSERSTAP
jgi:YihY family inner membrane protein